MKIAISIPDSLFEAAEKLADRLGISRSELYQRAVARLIGEQSGDSITAALNAVYGPSAEPGDLDPVLATMQTATLPDEDW